MGNAFQRNQLMATLCSKTMEYRGIGSGIIRALKCDPNIEFHNEISGDQFRVILWRNTQISNHSGTKIGKQTNQINEIGMETGKKTDQTNKIGMDFGMETDPANTIGEKIGKKDEVLLMYISENPRISINSLAKKSGMASSTVQIYLNKLRMSGKIRRVGPPKGGLWEVL